jgi:lysylphosphatidylglycerol synthetase-like protein (DUF2156 family)
MEKYSYILPLIMVLATLLSKFVVFDFVIIGNILGYSILTNVLGYLWFNRKHTNYCFFSRNVWYFLIANNVINILGTFISYKKYLTWSTIFILSVSLLLFFIHKKPK